MIELPHPGIEKWGMRQVSAKKDTAVWRWAVLRYLCTESSVFWFLRGDGSVKG